MEPLKKLTTELFNGTGENYDRMPSRTVKYFFDEELNPITYDSENCLNIYD